MAPNGVPFQVLHMVPIRGLLFGVPFWTRGRITRYARRYRYTGYTMQGVLPCNPGCFVRPIPKTHRANMKSILLHCEYMCDAARQKAVCNMRRHGRAHRFSIAPGRSRASIGKALQGARPCNPGCFVQLLPLQYMHVHTQTGNYGNTHA